MPDLDRIEVIRGPGATIWGANAVNGVVNITTKSARDTQGWLIDGVGGTHEQIGALRYGSRIARPASANDPLPPKADLYTARNGQMLALPSYTPPSFIRRFNDA